MQYNNIKNIFAPEVTNVDLAEKEIEYISMLIVGVNKKEVIKTLSFGYSKIRNLYNKLGLTDKTKYRDVQLATLFAMNDVIPKEYLKKLCEKYNLYQNSDILLEI